MASMYIKDGTLINEGTRFKSNILIEDGMICSISDLELEGHFDTVIDASQYLVLPGIIDDQVHFRDPGLTSKGSIASESKAAIAGGITSFMDMPNTIPPAVDLEKLQQKFSVAAADSWCNYSFYLGATNTNVSEIRRLDSSNVCGVKVFMGSSTGNLLVDDDLALQQIFSETGIPIAVHSEDEDTIKENVKIYDEIYQGNPPPEIHPLVRSREACIICTDRALKFARNQGGHLHLLHISTKEEVDMIRRAKEEGLNVTAEVCVHHLLFSDKDYAERGNTIKWNPSIKSEEDRLALIQGLKLGFLDIVATDHAPHEWHEKSKSYFSAPSGGPMVQHSLSVMLELAALGYFSVTDVVGWMAHKPADLFRIDKRGYLREGYYADLILVNDYAPWKVVGEETLYHCKWSPIDGMVLNSKVMATIVNGKLVYHHNRFFEDNRDPQALIFNR